MNPTQALLSLLSALAAAIWSVWTWSEEQHRERRLKRDQQAALYVNSFLIAIDELQSRFYSLLEQDELAYYREEYPEQYTFGSPPAIEILYRLSHFFGWGYRNFRYGPYTRDPRVVELVRRIGDTFESRSAFPGNAFRFSYDERVSLGHVVVQRVGQGSTTLPVFESIPLYQFEQELRDEESKHAPLFRSRAVRSTLAAIDRADRPESLEGRERLAVLQNLLVDLATYLEGAEGFSVSIGERRKAKVGTGQLQMLRAQTGVVRVLHQTEGRLRLGIPRLRTDDAYAKALQSLLQSAQNVTSVRITPAAASVVVCCSPDVPQAEFARAIVNAIEEASSKA
jgi:hypothetical protein